MEQKEILTKIKKLMGLSKSNNPYEAALALERALELMSKYSVSAETLRMSEVEEVASRAFKTKTLTDYQTHLLNSIQRLFGCACYHSRTYSYAMRKWVSNPVLVGLNPNVELAAYSFEVLSKKQEKARLGYIATLNKRIKRTTKAQRGNEFALGWAIGVSSAISNLVPDREMEPLVSEYFQKKTSSMAVATSRESKVSKKQGALCNGYLAGSRVDINKPIRGNKSVLKLG